MTKAQTITKEIYVAIYLRLSRDDQNGNTESMSISNQRDMLMSYCNERGWKIYDIYVDDGFTGTNFERPGFQRMIGDIEEGYISVVLTKDLSRLGRNYVMTGQYTDFFFPEHGVRYVAVNDSYDSAKEDNDIAPFKNILNEMYAKDISKKIRSARQISAKQGKFMGSKPPFGYVKSPEDRHLLVIDPPAAEIVKRLFREFAAGESGRNMATQLNAEDVDTPAEYYFKQTGKRATRSNTLQQWGSCTILQLLRNQVYIGDMVQCKRKVSSFKTKKRLATNPDAWVIVEGTHEPIIDRFTWECVQRRLDKTKRQSVCNSIRATRSGDINVFSGIIRCADCGAAMAFNERVNKNGTKYRFYRCSRYANSGSKSCSMHFMDADTLESIILSDIQFYAKTAVADEKKLMDRLLSFSEQARQNEKDAQGKALRDAINRISFIEDASKRLFEEKIAGTVPESLFRKMLSDYESELSGLEAKAEDIRQNVQEKVNSESDVKTWIKLIKECVSINSLDRATAFQLIDHVDVHEQTDENGHKSQSIQVKYNFVGVLS